MGIVKNIIGDQKNAIRNIFLKYKILISTVIILCVIIMITDGSSYDRDFINKILVFLVLFAAGSFFTETLDKSGWRRIIMYVVSACLAFIIDVLAAYAEYGDSRVLEWLGRVFYLYLIFLIGSALYIIIKNMRISFYEYATGLIFGLIRVAGVCLILCIGILLILSIICTLLADIPIWEIIVRLEYLLTGIFYAPYILICITNDRGVTSGFTKKFILYILMPLVLAATAIIYLYIIKIIVLRDIPSNEVFSICAWIFAIGAPIWTMARSYADDDDNGIYKKIIRLMRFIYAPFILLEIYSIGVRIKQYGITETRYFAILFIVFQIIYVIWERLREKLVFVLIGLYIIAYMLPFSSAEYVSYLSQRARLNYYRTAIEDGRQDTDELAYYEEYIEAYQYLEDNYYGKKYLSDEDVPFNTIYDVYNEYNEYGKEESHDYEDWQSISLTSYSGEEISISGYSRMYEFYFYDYGTEYDYSDLSSVYVEYAKYQKKLYIDISDLAASAIAHYEDYENPEPDMPYECVTSSGQKVVITGFEIDYEDNQEKYRKLLIKGYILE